MAWQQAAGKPVSAEEQPVPAFLRNGNEASLCVCVCVCVCAGLLGEDQMTNIIE